MLLNSTRFYVYYITCYFYVVPNVKGDFFKPSFVSKLIEAHIVMAEVSQACLNGLCESLCSQGVFMCVM